MRRIPYVLAALTALVAATPARALTCPLVPDPLDDGGRASLVGAELTSSTHLDLVGVDVASGPATVVARVHLQSLAPETVPQPHALWRVIWRIDGRDHAVHARRDPRGRYHAWYDDRYDGDTDGPAALAVDTAAATLTWTVARSRVTGLATPGVTFLYIRAETGIGIATQDSAHGFEVLTYQDLTPGCVPAS